MDYDGCLFTKSWTELGQPRKDVIKQTKASQKHGAEVILWTCREGKSLQEAISRCAQQGLEFDAINESCSSQKNIKKKSS
jgi:hypothetical protein